MLHSEVYIILSSIVFSKVNSFIDNKTVSEIKSKIHLGDCLEILTRYPDNFFDLIITSPPYADSRASTYGGTKPDEYVAWFLPRAQQMLRVLKPTGTFILNIKERVVEGERHTYVIELILKLRQQGWLWTEEFIWHKKNCYPGKWPNRFRDAWERCLQFNKNKKFNMYQDTVMVPIGNWVKTRLKNLSARDKIRYTTTVGSGFNKQMSKWVGRKMAYPSNVLHLAPETSNRQHSAVFPKDLPSWFIKLFTKESDWVLDPFCGAGTTCQVAQSLYRHSVGIELKQEYYELSKANLDSPVNYQLF